MIPQEIDHAKRQALQIIEQLPQRHLVPEERIFKWLDAMARREPDRLVWHALWVFRPIVTAHSGLS